MMRREIGPPISCVVHRAYGTASAPGSPRANPSASDAMSWFVPVNGTGKGTARPSAERRSRENNSNSWSVTKSNDWSAVFRSVSFRFSSSRKKASIRLPDRASAPNATRILLDCLREVAKGSRYRADRRFHDSDRPRPRIRTRLREMVGSGKPRRIAAVPSRPSCPLVFHHFARSISPTRAMINRNFNSRSKSIDA